MGAHPGWRRRSAPGDKCSAHWEHESGWQVRHCGHMTAIWPYFAVDPAHPDRVTSDQSGRGFQTLQRAFAAIDAVLSGQLAVFDDGPTKHGHRQVIADPHDLPPWLAQVLMDRQAHSHPGRAA